MESSPTQIEPTLPALCHLGGLKDGILNFISILMFLTSFLESHVAGGSCVRVQESRDLGKCGVALCLG